MVTLRPSLGSKLVESAITEDSNIWELLREFPYRRWGANLNQRSGESFKLLTWTGFY